MTARNAICRTSMSLLSNPVPRTDRKKSSNECSPTDSHIYDPGADDGIVLAQSGHREGVGCNFRARLVEKLANVRFGPTPDMPAENTSRSTSINALHRSTNDARQHVRKRRPYARPVVYLDTSMALSDPRH